MLLLALLATLAQAEDMPLRYQYRGIVPEGVYSAAEIGAFLRKNPTATHEVRRDEWDEWRLAGRVPDIVDAWLNDPVTEAPGASVPALEAVVPDSGDGGHAPRNAPESPPGAEPVSTAEAAVLAPLDGVRGLGELWLGVGFDPSTTQAPTLSLRRLAAGVAVDGGLVSGRVYLSAGGVEALVVEDAWLRIEEPGPTGAFGRIGIARPAFGLADDLEDGRRFWVAGASAELDRAGGFFPQATLGVGGGGGTQRWDLTGEVADAGGTSPTEVVDLDAVEARGRVRGDFGDDALGVRVGGSVAWRTPALGESTPRTVAAISAAAHSERLSIVGEFLAGVEGDDGVPLVGGLVLLAVDTPVGGALRSFGLVVGGGGWDPTLTGLPDEQDTPDATYDGRAGANLHWSAPGSSLLTGVGYHLTVPQDIEAPIAHALLVEAAWRY